MGAAWGAGPCPQITSTLPLRTACTITGTSPPGPLRCGSTTCKVKAVATAASKALPPFSSVPMPTAVAIQCVEVTTPNVPSISGRVVKGFGLTLEILAFIATLFYMRRRFRRTGWVRLFDGDAGGLDQLFVGRKFLDDKFVDFG